MPDSIQFKADLNPDSVITGAKEIKQALGSLEGAVKQMGSDLRTSVAGFSATMNGAVASSKDFSAQISKMKSDAKALKGVIGTDEYKKLAAEIDDCKDSLDSLTKQRDKLVSGREKQVAAIRKDVESSLGMSKKDAQGAVNMSGLLEGANELVKKQLQSEIDKMVDEQVAALGRLEETNPYQEIQAQIDVTIGKLDELQARMAQVSAAQDKQSYEDYTQAARDASQSDYDAWEAFNNSDTEEVMDAAEALRLLGESVHDVTDAKRENASVPIVSDDDIERYQQLVENAQTATEQSEAVRHALGGGDEELNWDYLRESGPYEAAEFKILQHIRGEIETINQKHEATVDRINEARDALQAEREEASQLADTMGDLGAEQEQHSGHGGGGANRDDEPDNTRDKTEDLQEQSSAADVLRESIQGVSAAISRNIGLWQRLPPISRAVETAFDTAFAPVLHPIQTLDRAIGGLVTGFGRLAASLARMAGSGAISFLKRLASGAQNAAIQLMRLTSNAVTSGLKKIASGAAMAAKGMLRFARGSRSSHNGLKTGLKTILKYAFGVRSMFFLFRRLRAAVTQAFNEMAKSSPELKTAIDSLQVALNGLKGSLATAFAPIFTAIAPALTYLINMLTAALNTVGAFMAALTGGTTFKKASGNMKATGKAAGGAAKKAKELKRELAGFDELNILNGDKNNGGGGGGGSGSGITYTTQAIPDGIKGFVDRLKELWANKEYVKIGKIIADWINNAFEHAKELITWENVEEKMRGFVDAVTGILEGLFTYVNWELIGSTVSAGFRTVFNTLNLLFKKRNLFTKAGLSLAAMINGFFKDPNLWTDLADTVTNAVLSFFAFGQAFLDGFDAETAGNSIYTALTSIKWGEIAESLWGVIKTAFNKAGSFVNALLGGGQGEDNSELKQYARKRPTTINFKPKYSVDDSVWDEVADTLTEGFNTVVEKLTTFISEHSITDVVGALADWLIKVKDGVSWEAVGTFIGTAFKGALDGIGTWITKWGGEAETIGNDIAKAINGFIDSAFAGDAIADYFTTAVKSAFSLVKGFVEKIDEEKAATEIKKAIEGVDWKGIAETAWEAFKTAVSKLGNFLTILFGGDVDPADAVGEAVRTGKSYQEAIEEANKGKPDLSAKGLAKTLGDAVSAMIETLDTWIKGIDWSEVAAGLKEFLVNLPWDEWAAQLAQALTDLFDSIREFFAGLVFGEEGGKTYSALRRGESTYGGTQYKKAEAGEVSQEFYDAYAKLSEQARKYVENMLNAGAFTLDIGQALDITGWDELTSEMQYAYFLALEDSFGGEKTFEYLKKHGKEVTDALAEGIKAGDINVEEDGENAVLTFADGTKTQLAKSSEELQGLFETLGVDSIAGLVQAFGDEQTTATDAITEDMNAVVDAASETVDVNSPSKVFQEIGEFIVDGLILGLQTLPQALQGVWQGLPQWAQALLGNAAGQFNLAISGGVSGNGGGTDSKDGKSSVKATKRQTKETKKLTKETKKNTEKRAEVDVNYEGAGFDTSSGKPTLNVGVNFAPEGEEPTDENKNSGLLTWLQSLFDTDTVEAKVALIRKGWDNFKGWLKTNGLDENSPIGQLIELLLKDFDSVMDFLGIDPNSPIGTFLKLVLSKAKDLLDFLGIDPDTPISTVIQLVLQKFKDIMDFLGIPKDSPIRTFIDLLLGNTDPEVDKAFDKDGSTISTFVNLVKQGFTTFLKFLGIDTDNPLIQTAIKLISENFTSFLSFLGIDTSNPLIKTIVDLLCGKTEDGAEKALDAEDKEANTLIDLLFGKSDDKAEKALDAEDKEADTVMGLFDGKFDVNAMKALDASDKNVTTTENLKSGTEDDSARKSRDAASKSTTTTVKLSNGGQDGTAVKNRDAGNKTATTTMVLSNGGEDDSAVKSRDATDSTVTKTIDIALGKENDEVKTALNGSAKKKPITLTNSSSNATITSALNGKEKKKPIKLTNSDGKTTPSVALNGKETKKPITLTDNNTTTTPSVALNGIANEKPIKLTDADTTTTPSVALNGETKTKPIKLKNADDKTEPSIAVNGKAKTKKIKLVRSSGSSDTIKSAVDGNKKTKKIKLVNDSGSSGTLNNTFASGVFKKAVEVTLKLASGAVSALRKLLGLAKGGIVTNGGQYRKFASGGIIRGGMARYLDNVPHYASGSNRAHGTVFVAGEAGPEIMGHINGRTEILNKSQLAEAIYAAVVSGMSNAVNALGSYLANHMTNCTNSIVQTIGANAGISQLNGLDYYAPAMVTNGIMPYDVSMQIARSTAALQDTLDSNNEELIQAMVSAMGNAAQSIVQVLQRQMMQNSAGNNGLNVQQVTNAINRQTLMFGASPLKGV